MNRGFTLLEVLIALVILSIGMLGVYRLAYVSADTASYSEQKAFVTEACYQRVMELMNYPGKNFKDKKRLPDGTEIKFSTETGAALYSEVNEMKLTCESNDIRAVYYYYESQQ